MSGAVLFFAGWAGLSVIVVAVAVAVRARQNFDALGPGTRRSVRRGCLCSRRANLGGWREAVTGTSILARRCPVIAHHAPARARMYNYLDE